MNTKDDDRLLPDFFEQLRLRGFTEASARTYRGRVKNLRDYYRRSPLECSAAEVRAYFLHLIDDRRLAPRSITLTRRALECFFRGHGRAELIRDLPRLRAENKGLPVVLDYVEIEGLLDAANSLRDRTMLLTIYSAGLRLGEAARLRPGDLDFARRQLHVRLGKGRKDRLTLLPPACHEALRNYLRRYRPQHYLFYPRDAPHRPLNHRRIQSIFEDALRRSGCRKRASVGALWHSFATHLLECGTDIQAIRGLLGHASLRTTLRYLHLRRPDLMGIESPLDQGRIRLPESPRLPLPAIRKI